MARESGARARGTLILAAAALAAGLFAASAPATALACPHASAQPGTVSLGKLRRATLCLVNKARQQRDVRELRANSDLQVIAQAHAKVMARRACLAHQCEGEPSLKRRFKLSAYVKGASSFDYAEEVGFESTPKQMVSRWLERASHRQNLVNGKLRDLGVGVNRGAPVGQRRGRFMTYTLDFGALHK